MNLAVPQLFEECLALVNGDKAAASLTLAAPLRECQPAALASGVGSGPRAGIVVTEATERLHVATLTAHKLCQKSRFTHHRVCQAIRTLPADSNSYQRHAADAVRPKRI